MMDAPWPASPPTLSPIRLSQPGAGLLPWDCWFGLGWSGAMSLGTRPGAARGAADAWLHVSVMDMSDRCIVVGVRELSIDRGVLALSIKR